MFAPNISLNETILSSGINNILTELNDFDKVQTTVLEDIYKIYD